MFTWLSVKPANDEANQFAEVLKEYSNVFFSKGDSDLGCFDGIKMRIDTVCLRPMRQNVRKTPFHFEKKEEEYLTSMFESDII